MSECIRARAIPVAFSLRSRQAEEGWSGEPKLANSAPIIRSSSYWAGVSEEVRDAAGEQAARADGRGVRDAEVRCIEFAA